MPAKLQGESPNREFWEWFRRSLHKVLRDRGFVRATVIIRPLTPPAAGFRSDPSRFGLTEDMARVLDDNKVAMDGSGGLRNLIAYAPDCDNFTSAARGHEDDGTGEPGWTIETLSNRIADKIEDKIEEGVW